MERDAAAAAAKEALDQESAVARIENQVGMHTLVPISNADTKP